MNILISKNTIFYSLFLILFLFILISCGDSSKKGNAPNENSEKSPVALSLSAVQIPSFDSLVISGYGIDTFHISKKESVSLIELELAPYKNWVLHGKLYALNGTLVQEGYVEFEVLSGKSHGVILILRALVGYLHFEIPLGLNNPLGITSGNLRIRGENIDTTLTLERSEAYAYFTSGILALNKTYSVEMKLYNKEGELLYSLEENFLLDSENPVPQWELISLYGHVALTVSADLIEAYPISTPIRFPGSQKRKPAFGDLIITEFLANPKTNGDSFKYIEIYNGTLDTLILDSCIIGANSGTTSGNKIASEHQILPTSFMVIGGDSVVFADIKTGKLTLTQSGQTLVFHCEGITIDSIAYGSKSDSLQTAIPVSTGKSTQLPLSHWQERQDGGYWCLGNNAFDIGETLLYGSPGKDAVCP